MLALYTAPRSVGKSRRRDGYKQDLASEACILSWEMTMSMEQSWRDWLLGYARRWCRCEDDAHDLVQEALLAFYIRHQRCSPWEWADADEARRHTLRILRDKLVEQKRCQRITLSYESLDATLPDPAHSIHNLYGRVHRNELFERLLTCLPPRQQTVLKLLQQGLELHEIGEQVGISLGTVKRYVHLIRQKVAELSDLKATSKPPSFGIIDDTLGG